MANRSAGHADPTQSREGRHSTARLVFYVSAASCTSATGKARRIVKSLNPTFRPFATQTPIYFAILLQAVLEGLRLGKTRGQNIILVRTPKASAPMVIFTDRIGPLRSMNYIRRKLQA